MSRGPMRQLATVLGCILMMSSVTFGEMEKIAVPNDRGVSLLWWPRLQAVPGWHHDGEASVQLGVNAFVPDGSTFANAETVMYAKAVSRPPAPGPRSLAAFIESDRKEFLARQATEVVYVLSWVNWELGASRLRRRRRILPRLCDERTLVAWL